jgi:chitin synthase
VVQDTEHMQEDLDAIFKDTINRAMTKLDIKEVLEKPSMDDQNWTFQTHLVVFWMLMNAGLAIAIENINGLLSHNESVDEQDLHLKQNIYFAFILYSTFGLSLVQFIGISSFRFSLFPNLSLFHPVLVVLVQVQSFCVLQEVMRGVTVHWFHHLWSCIP